MSPAQWLCRVPSRVVRFYRRPIRVVGTIALLAMPAACAFCVEHVVPPQAVENTTFCVQYVTEGKLDEAESRAKLAIEFSPKYAEAWNCRGLVEYHRGHLDLAIDDFKRAISYKNDFAEAHNNLGAIFMNERREYAEAEDQFRNALEIDPGYVSARANLGLTLYYEQNLDEAKDQFMRCLELKPDDCGCRMGMGIIAIAHKDWADCRDHFEKHTQICPSSAEGYYNLGYCYFQLGRCREAYNAFISSLAIKEDYIEARQNLVTAMDCLGRQDAAVQRLMDKIRQNPGDAELHFKLGSMWEDKQEYDNARAEFSNVIKIKPDDKLAYYRLARLYNRNNQKDETITYCQKFVDLLRDEPWAEEKSWCISRVKELQFGLAP
jgi:tetratricopeptide (TPR) repeat protein